MLFPSTRGSLQVLRYHKPLAILVDSRSVIQDAIIQPALNSYIATKAKVDCATGTPTGMQMKTCSEWHLTHSVPKAPAAI